MRLLRYDERGALVLTTDLPDETIPPYAILSHTWGADADEVTFEDITNRTGTGKTGYDKIRFCGEQARSDGLCHFWIDTCCIDKSNRAELSHSIRSMFRWYRNAVKCYVYLADVPTSALSGTQQTSSSWWESSFRSSRWFDRGWTLQELLAPSIVEFFSNEKCKLGDRETLKLQIHQITDIPLAVLEGSSLYNFSVEERLRWKAHRETKREEDGAYSLQGLFGVDLAPLYNEGAANAFRRLKDEIDKQERCIRDLRGTDLRGTDLRGTDPRDDKKRIEDMKGGLLKDSYRWILDNRDFQQWHNLQHQLLWIKGDPGKGKTMLLCGIIDELHGSANKRTLVAYFFCQAADSRINSATAVLRGLLYMLVSQQPSLIRHVRKRHDHAGKSAFEDANAWISLTAIFADVLQDPHLDPTYLLIDALDECVAIDLPKLLDFIAQHSSVSGNVKWLVSSRNSPDIDKRVGQASQNVRLSLELNAEAVSRSVRHFIEQKVSWLAQQNQYDDQTRMTVVQYLELNADNTFLWVALVCQNLKKTAQRNVLKKLCLFPPGLDAVYERMLQCITTSDDAELCRQILATTAVAYQPLTISELAVLVQTLQQVDDEMELADILSSCGSFLTIRNKTVYFVHQSARDFLLTAAAKGVFPNGREDVHYTVLVRSFEILSQKLRRDMCNMKSLGHHTDDIEGFEPDPLASIRYSCVYWIDHLCASHFESSVFKIPSALISDLVYNFLRRYYLYWLEALSICRSVPKGILSLNRLQAFLKGTESNPLSSLLYDARRFIIYHQVAIENTPLQAYASALLFSPAESLIRKLFQHEEPEYIRIIPAMSDRWNTCLQTLEGHTSAVSSVVFSHDSTRLASASDDHTLKIWDASSGACLQTLKGHTSAVSSVVFSHDSTRLASASYDHTIKLWDASTSACLQTLKGHTDYVTSVVLSHDSTRLASASGDNTVKIWDASSGACLQTLHGHTSAVSSVVFSHDSTRLASASWGNTVKIWDASSGTCLQTLEDHNEFVNSVVFSHDSTRLASASYDRTLKIWDASSGACLQTLEGHTSIVNSVVFSHESTQLASASADNTVKIWDASSGACLQTLYGQTSIVTSVVFSHDSTWLASASYDKTIKIWDPSIGAYPQTLDGHTSAVASVVFSHDSTWLASTSYDKTIKIWDTGTGACLRTLEGHTRAVNDVVFSHDSTRLASASDDRTLKIWDAGTGACLQTLEGHTSDISSTVFLHDSTRLASASWDNTVKIWDASTGACLRTLEGHTSAVTSVVFSHESTRLASASYDKTLRIWDASSGACLQTLEGHTSIVNSVVFSHDSTRLTSRSWDRTIKVWDATSGLCLKTLDMGETPYNFVLESTRLFLQTEFGAIDISASVPTYLSDSIDAQILRYESLGFSTDRTWLTCDGRNLLWVPSEYRYSCSAVGTTMTGIGTGSGRVWICTTLDRQEGMKGQIATS